MKPINTKKIVLSIFVPILALFFSVCLFSVGIPITAGISQQFTSRSSLVGAEEKTSAVDVICQRSLRYRDEYLYCSPLNFAQETGINILLYFLVLGFATLICIFTIPSIIIMSIYLYRQAKTVDLKANTDFWKIWLKKYILITFCILFLLDLIHKIAPEIFNSFFIGLN